MSMGGDSSLCCAYRARGSPPAKLFVKKYSADRHHQKALVEHDNQPAGREGTHGSHGRRTRLNRKTIAARITMDDG